MQQLTIAHPFWLHHLPRSELSAQCVQLLLLFPHVSEQCFVLAGAAVGLQLPVVCIVCWLVLTAFKDENMSVSVLWHLAFI